MTALDDQVEAILAGTNGVAFDPRDFSTMWRDAAGLFPVTRGDQSVGLIRSRFGDTTAEFSQPTAAARPSLQDGELLFDGVDDILLTFNRLNIMAGVPAGTWVTSLTKLAPAEGVARVLNVSTGGSNTQERFSIVVQTDDTMQWVTRRPDATLSRMLLGTVPVNARSTLTYLSDFAGNLDSIARINGIQVGQIALPGPPANSDATPSGAARFGSATVRARQGRTVLLPWRPTPAEILTLEGWVVEGLPPVSPAPGPLNFPSAPIVGQVYQAEGATFVWNGTLWVVLSPSSAIFASQAEAEAGLRDDVLLSPLRAKEAIVALSPAPPPINLGVAICRAWCRYNGETHTIIDQFNVASLLNEGGGINRLVFATPLPDANYVILGNCRGVVNHPALQVGLSTTVPSTVENCRVVVGATGGSGVVGFNRGSPLVHVSIWS